MKKQKLLKFCEKTDIIPKIVCINTQKYMYIPDIWNVLVGHNRCSRVRLRRVTLLCCIACIAARLLVRTYAFRPSRHFAAQLLRSTLHLFIPCWLILLLIICLSDDSLLNIFYLRLDPCFKDQQDAVLLQSSTLILSDICAITIFHGFITFVGDKIC